MEPVALVNRVTIRYGREWIDAVLSKAATRAGRWDAETRGIDESRGCLVLENRGDIFL